MAITVRLKPDYGSDGALRVEEKLVERATGIEPVSEAWEASVLPLY